MPAREVKQTLVSYLDEEGIRRYGLAGETVSVHADTQALDGHDNKQIRERLAACVSAFTSCFPCRRIGLPSPRARGPTDTCPAPAPRTPRPATLHVDVRSVDLKPDRSASPARSFPR
jgi:hypothetical protein